MQLFGDFFQCEQAGSVERRHVAKAQNDDGWQSVQILGYH